MNLNIDKQAAKEEMARLEGHLDGLRQMIVNGEQQLKEIEEAIKAEPDEVIQKRGFLYHEVEELLEPILSALRLSSPILAGAPHYADLINHIALMVTAMMDIMDKEEIFLSWRCQAKKKKDFPCQGRY
jgi:hypothetical protein